MIWVGSSASASTRAAWGGGRASRVRVGEGQSFLPCVRAYVRVCVRTDRSGAGGGHVERVGRAGSARPRLRARGALRGGRAGGRATTAWLDCVLSPFSPLVRYTVAGRRVSAAAVERRVFEAASARLPLRRSLRSAACARRARRPACAACTRNTSGREMSSQNMRDNHQRAPRQSPPPPPPPPRSRSQRKPRVHSLLRAPRTQPNSGASSTGSGTSPGSNSSRARSQANA